MHIVHVTHHNALMWNNGGAPTHVIEHGVLLPPGLQWDGGKPEGIAVVSRQVRRGRRPGADLYARFAGCVPLTLAGKGSEQYGGIGEVPNAGLPALMAKYRFYLHPVHYTSQGLSLIEAMMLGMPVVVLATPELPSVIRDGVDGCVDTRSGRLLEAMQDLLADAALARRWGEAARATARKYFGIERFSADWDRLLRQACAAWRPLAIAA
jgi:glycosyltransferase involved in cell wall biosynthesis